MLEVNFSSHRTICPPRDISQLSKDVLTCTRDPCKISPCVRDINIELCVFDYYVEGEKEKGEFVRIASDKLRHKRRHVSPAIFLRIRRDTDFSPVVCATVFFFFFHVLHLVFVILYICRFIYVVFLYYLLFTPLQFLQYFCES